MLHRLHIRNFTVFADAEFGFGPGLNVLVGTNGTGKSHVLKLGYAVLHNWLGQTREMSDMEVYKHSFVRWGTERKLKRVFQPLPFEGSELIRRGAGIPQTSIEVTMVYPSGQVDRNIIIGNNSSQDSGSSRSPDPDLDAAEGFLFADPVFIPAKEVLTLGWLLPLYDRREVPMDETYPDLLRLLAVLPLKSPEPAAAKVLAKLRQVLGGEIDEEGGRYYLTAPRQARMEMNLVAEGWRKFATLYKLLANGTLTPQTTLFWDEPEANLNPALLRELAAVLSELARQGFQVVLATHSMSLLKEFHILSRQSQAAPLPIRYFGLNAAPGQATTVVTADDFELLPDIVALDVELAQADALEQIFAKEDQLPDADHH